MVDHDSPLLVTGATGFLGSHFVYHALRSGARVEALVRARDDDEARARILEALARAAAGYCEAVDLERMMTRVDVLRGDICEPLCGVDPASRPASRGAPSGAWHFAASLSFEARHRERILVHNFGGTCNTLALAAALGARRFVHVSTAYAAGTRSGTIAEVLHADVPGFNNSYEESKHAAESEVLARCAALGLDARVVRPSIVVGPSTTRRSGGTDNGMYGFIREIHRMREALRNVGRPLRVRGDLTTPVNLVPVDWVAEELWQLHGEDFPGGPFYHLTSARGPTVEEALGSLSELLELPGFDVRAVEEAEMTPLEQVFNRRTVFYSSYLRAPKTFERARPARGDVGATGCREYMRMFLRELAAETGDLGFSRATVRSFDDFPLVAFRSGAPKSPPVVLINAYGMPFELMAPLGRQLADGLRVITWESRGAPGLSGELVAERCRSDTHARDLAAILVAEGCGPAHIIGWCTGAPVAVKFAELFPTSVRTLTLLNGAFPLAGLPRTPFQESMRSLMPKVAASLDAARFYHRVVFGGEHGGDERAQVSRVLGEVDPSLVHLTSLSFRSPAALHRYALLLREFFAELDEREPPSVTAPTLVLTGTNDQVADPVAAAAVGAQIPGARQIEMTGGDHYSMYFDPAVGRMIAGFIAEAEPQRS